MNQSEITTRIICRRRSKPPTTKHVLTDHAAYLLRRRHIRALRTLDILTATMEAERDKNQHRDRSPRAL